MDACAIAGFTVGINSTTVPDGFERLNPGFDNFATRFAVNRPDKTHATVGVFFCRIIHAACLKIGSVLFKAGDLNSTRAL